MHAPCTTGDRLDAGRGTPGNPRRTPFSVRSSLLRLLQIPYGVYALLAFVIMGLSAFVLVLLPLGMRARRRIAHAVARTYFHVAGMPLALLDAHHLPEGPCVVVANHASYLDGIVLKAALPARFSFVIKKEFSRVPFAGMLLRRIGSEFVDRFNRHAGAMDARRLMKAADGGQALAFFPEGTFLREPGVGKFHSGAFVIAARTQLPVVPVAIRGTRHILPSDRILPRPGRIEVQVLTAIAAPDTSDQAVSVPEARERARTRILAAVGEPDLAQKDGLATLAARRR